MVPARGAEGKQRRKSEVKRCTFLVILLFMLPALACNFSVDLGGETTESAEPGPLETALATQPPTEAPTVVLFIADADLVRAGDR